MLDRSIVPRGDDLAAEGARQDVEPREDVAQDGDDVEGIEVADWRVAFGQQDALDELDEGKVDQAAGDGVGDLLDEAGRLFGVQQGVGPWRSWSGLLVS